MEYIAGNIDIAVVGAGHAGIEAALAGARLGCKTVLFTINLDAVGNMPCNPSIGGSGKGHLVCELDALGGEMGKNADATQLQSKTLNRSRGPAVWATRCQCAKKEYSERMQQTVAQQPNLTVLEDDVIALKLSEDNKKIIGVETSKHSVINSKTVVVTSGTALRGRIWIGKDVEESAGDARPAVNQLSSCLENLGFKLIRLKTGTPPRLKANSCDFSKCQRQDGENPRPLFHVEQNNPKSTSQMFHVEQNTLELPEFPCWLTHTNEITHEIIRNNLGNSALYGGAIEGTGVRYCPSIEDKIVRFTEAKSHHVMLEPEDSAGKIIYPNGLSCSLPKNVQIEMVHSIAGLEKAEFIKYASRLELTIQLLL